MLPGQPPCYWNWRAPKVRNTAQVRKVGLHVSIAAGLPRSVPRALARCCETFQIFCANPRGWNLSSRSQEELEAFRLDRRAAGLEPLFVHSCYLINCCAADEGVFRKSVSRLAYELETSAALGAGGYVLHPGTCKARPARWRLKRAARAIGKALDLTHGSVPILLETTASSHGPGGGFEQLGELAASVESSSARAEVGFCVDSCHVFARGYDLRIAGEVDRLVAHIEDATGPGRVRLLHLNDSRDECGSGRDRHQHLGEGTIGPEGLRNFLTHPALDSLPVILETPWESEAVDRRNIQGCQGIGAPAAH